MDFWKSYFDYNQLETESGDRKKEFDFSINTDGVSLSFSMKITAPSRKVVPEADDNAEMPLVSNKKLRNIKERLHDRYYEKFVGLDPGRRLMVGGN